MPKYLNVETILYDNYPGYYKQQVEEIGNHIYCIRQRIKDSDLCKVYTYNKVDIHAPKEKKGRGKYKARTKKTIRKSGVPYNKVSVARILKALNNGGIEIQEDKLQNLIGAV